MDNILEEFKSRGFRLGPDYYLFRADDATAKIKRCRELNKKIHGIDVFKNEEGNEIVDYIDYTTIGYREWEPSKYYEKFHIEKDKDIGHWEEAKKFLEDRMHSEYVFELVYGE